MAEEARHRKGALEHSPESSQQSQWSPKKMMDWLKIQTEKRKFTSTVKLSWGLTCSCEGREARRLQIPSGPRPKPELRPQL